MSEFGNNIKAILTKDNSIEITLHPVVLNKTFAFSKRLLPIAEFLNKYVYLDKTFYIKLAMTFIPKQRNRFFGWIKEDEFKDEFDDLKEHIGDYFKIGGQELNDIINIIRLKSEKDEKFIRKILEHIGYNYKKYRKFGIKYNYKKEEVKRSPQGLNNWFK